MHSLHAILVYIPYVDISGSGLYEEEKIKDIRRYAESCTEEYYMQAFDWRTTDDAGRWATKYPNNVILCSSDREEFFKILEEIEECQKDVIKKSITLAIEEDRRVSTANIEEVLSIIDESWAAGFYLSEALSLARGKYIFTSRFYNTKDDTSKITEELRQEILKAPDDYALVLMDYHM